MAQIWARVRDKITGHEYDVTVGRLQILLQRGQVEEIAYLGKNGRHKGNPRPAKHRPRTLAPPPTPRPTKAAGTTTKKEDESP